MQVACGFAQQYQSAPAADLENQQINQIGATYEVASNRNSGYFDSGENQSSGSSSPFQPTTVTDDVFSNDQLRNLFNTDSHLSSAPQRAQFDPTANRLPETQQVDMLPRVAPQEFSSDQNPLRRFDESSYTYDTHDRHIELASYNPPVRSAQQDGFSVKQQTTERVAAQGNELPTRPAQWQPDPSPAVKTTSDALSPAARSTATNQLARLDGSVVGADTSGAAMDNSVEKTPRVYGPVISPELENRWDEHESVFGMSIAGMAERLQQKKSEIEATTSLNEDDKLLQLEKVNSAHQAVLNASQSLERKLALESKIADFQETYQRLKQVLSQPTTPRTLDENITTEQLQAKLRITQQALTDQNNSLQQILDAAQQQAHRAEDIPAERADANRKLSEIREKLLSNRVPGKDDFVMLLRAQELESEAKVELLLQESAWLDMASQLLPLEQDIATRSIKGLKAEITDWDKSLGQLRRVELQAEIAAARRSALDTHPALKSFAQRTTELARQRASLAESNEKVGREKFEVQTQSHDLEEDHKNLVLDVKSIGTASVGSLMIEVRRAMPLPFESHTRIREIGVELQSIKLASHRLKEERKALGDPHEFIVDTLGIEVADDVASTNMREMALELIETQREQIDELSREYTTYGRLLEDVVREREILKSQILATRKFIDKNALWIPSTKRIDYYEVVETQSAIKQLFDRDKWAKLSNSIVASAVHKPYGPALGLCGLFLVIFVQRRLKP
jgi:hypothetical protein